MKNILKYIFDKEFFVFAVPVIFLAIARKNMEEKDFWVFVATYAVGQLSVIAWQLKERNDYIQGETLTAISQAEPIRPCCGRNYNEEEK